MVDEINKDVVGARIRVDTSKILKEMKVIDDGAMKNAQSFKTLNEQLKITEKSYASMARSMDKVALSSSERRKKILDESNALVAQRRAQAELYQARSQSLNRTNELVDSRLRAQQALVRRREEAIEQQERQHQQRMETLRNQSVASEGRNNILRARLDREYQIIRNNQMRIEQQTERHNAQMHRLNQTSTSSLSFLDDDSSSSHNLLDYMGKAALHATVFHGVYSAINVTQEAIREGLVDIEANMAGYIQTNEKYFVSFNEGTHEMVMNMERLHEESTKFIQTAHDLGAEIGEVTESARLWGRMYKDVNIVQEMVRASTKLSTVDLVGLEEATKGMESTLAQYGVQIRDVNDAQVEANRLLDAWSSVAHNTMAPAADLAAAFERTGKIANETGISFDFMNGLISSGVRNTALAGANLGNMWKTVLGTIRTDKAVNEIESLGVATKEVVDGTEQWRKAEDILLDLSIKVIDKNYDLTKSYQNISRGVFQFAKLAASLNVGDILLGESASINSTGSTMEYLKVQMDTIQRKAAQTKASLLEIINTAGDDGLRSSIKGALDVLDQLLIGLANVPKETFRGVASVTALIVAYKAIYKPIMAWVAAERALTAARAAATISMTEQTAGVYAYSAAMTQAARTTALATGGLTILAGVIATYLFTKGAEEKAERDAADERERAISVMEREYKQYTKQAEFLPKLVRAHNQLKQQLEDGNLSVEKQTEVKDQLEKISRALTQTIGEEGLAQLKAAGYTDEATQRIIASLNTRKRALKEDMQAQLEQQSKDIEKQIKAAEEKVKKAKDRLDDPGATRFFRELFLKNPLRPADLNHDQKVLDEANKELDGLKEKADKIEEKSISIGEDLNRMTMQGMEGKRLREQADYNAIKQNFQNEYNEFKHLVNMKVDGYQTAAEQAEKLKSIRDRFKDQLVAQDLWGIEEDIVSISQGSMKNPSGYSPPKKDDFEFPLDAIDDQVEQAESMIESATSLMDFYEARKGAFGSAVNDAAQRIELYTNRQDKLHQANEMLRASLIDLGDRQQALNELYNKGNIELDDYKKYSEDVQDRIKSLNKDIDANSLAWLNDAKAIKEVKQQQLQDDFDFSSNWIAHQKAIGQLNARQEYEAWVRVQQRYMKGTELRKRADEEVYAAKQALLQNEQQDLDDFLSREKEKLNEAKQQELDAIEQRKQAYIDAQDEKITAIDRLMKAEQQQNEDEDYGQQLAEKKARAKLLESAVGPEGINERKQVLKDIAELEENHQRELRKRDLESQKQALIDEKNEKLQAFEDEKEELESHYDDLLMSFEDYKENSNSIQDAIKDFRIQSSEEANQQILKDLDKFIQQYNQKVSSINAFSQTQAELDYEKYLENQQIWKDPNSTALQKQQANEENIKFRDKYGISQDDYLGIQHFADGGVVSGMRGQAVPIVAHGGEMFINDQQQSNLFKLLNYAMPQINFSTPSFDVPNSNVQYITQNFDMSVGEANLYDNADIGGMYNERGVLVKRLEAKLGVKVR